MAYCFQGQQSDGVEAMEVDDEEGYGRAEALTECSGGRQEGGNMPPHWLKVPADRPVVAVDLSKTSDEYNSTLALFLSSFSLPKATVCRIYRIQSAFLWKHFLLKGEEMKQECGRRGVEEKQLFHGTKCINIDGICRKGFDWRLSARTKYGEGCYFARNSSYSHLYSPRTDSRQNLPHILQHTISHPPPPQIPLPSPSCSASSPPAHHPPGQGLFPQGVSDRVSVPFLPVAERTRHASEDVLKLSPSVPPRATVPSAFPTPSCPGVQPSLGPGGLRYMFVARVLIGRTVRGHTSYRRPPSLHPGDPYGASFDTCVDYEQDPRIFVVFDCNQAYPEYLLEYHCDLD